MAGKKSVSAPPKKPKPSPPASKADLAALATKADLEKYATKAELAATEARLDAAIANCATKADLEKYATKEDLAATKVELSAAIAQCATKAELAAAVAPLATNAALDRLREDTRNELHAALEIWAGALRHDMAKLEERMSEKLSQDMARHFGAALEQMQRWIAGLDDKYSSLPARVAALEAHASIDGK